MKSAYREDTVSNDLPRGHPFLHLGHGGRRAPPCPCCSATESVGSLL